RGSRVVCMSNGRQRKGVSARVHRQQPAAETAARHHECICRCRIAAAIDCDICCLSLRRLAHCPRPRPYTPALRANALFAAIATTLKPLPDLHSHAAAIPHPLSLLLRLERAAT
ncbi:hypothetical protein Dimus_000719, partial [Dionaea muscipula]